MSHDITLCVTIRCDRCLVTAQTREGSDLRHWESLEQALADLSGPAGGWEAGPRSQTCPSCVRALVCQNHGHDWGPWQAMLPVPLGCEDLAVRVCDRCGLDEVIALECLGRSPVAGGSPR